ncbi:hypothetical protein Bbelb_068120 [Branchiostoma belcheri]|nr:hypothetical protein Bbelb_068120 [Branchiostoma belcheri]
MRAVSLLCLVLTTAVVQGYPVWKRDEGISETQAVNLEQNLLDAIVKKKKEEQTDGSTEKRDAFMADLQKAHDFEKKFSKDGQLHDHGLKTAQAVREFLKADKAWEAKKKGLKVQEYRSNEEEVGKRSAFMDDLLDSLQFEKRFSKYGDLSANEMNTAKALREYVEFAKEWSEKKGLFDDIFGDSSSSEEDSSSSEEDSSSSDEDGDEEKKQDSSSSDEDSSSSSSSDEESKKQDSSSSDEDSSSSSSSSSEEESKKQDSSSSDEDSSSSSSSDEESKKQDSSSSDEDSSSSSSSSDEESKKQDSSSSDEDSSSSSSDEESKKQDSLIFIILRGRIEETRLVLF